MQPNTVPHHIRPINFAGVELFLDLIQCARQVYGDVDTDSIVVLMCVSDASMRPFMLSEETPREVMTALTPPEHVRGSISRRLIADKTGLPRETVRRKVAQLARLGHLVVDKEGRVRIAHGLATPATWAIIEQGHRAVLRYLDRLAQFGVDPDAADKHGGA